MEERVIDRRERLKCKGLCTSAKRFVDSAGKTGAIEEEIK
jgi:hypothetical protein